jgi:ankyrin repeat protein
MKNRNFLIVFIIVMLFIIYGCAAKSPLIRASSSGDSSTVQKLINEGANVNEPDSRGYTPLMHAVWSRDVETVQVLLNKGVDVNAKDKKGYTALLWASSYGLNDIAKYLIAKGANVNVKGNDNSTPYFLAVWTNNTELAKLLISKGADKDIEGIGGTTNILSAVHENNVELVKLLIDNGADLNIKDRNGYTPIFWASSYGYLDIAKLLINKGADINAIDKRGYNALLYTAEKNCYGADITDITDISKLLIESGTDINAKNSSDETVLDIALACRQGALVDNLIIAGVNLWKPENGKARVFFIDNGLEVYIIVQAGSERYKELNKKKNGGVAFIDIEPGQHEILAEENRINADWSSRAKLESPIKVKAGEIFYFRVEEREWGFWEHLNAFLSAFDAFSPRPYPMKFVTVAEAEAKREIKNILKSKEIK